MRCRAEDRDPTRQEIQAFRKSMYAFVFLPGERASFTVSDISAGCLGNCPIRLGLPASTVKGYGG